MRIAFRQAILPLTALMITGLLALADNYGFFSSQTPPVVARHHNTPEGDMALYHNRWFKVVNSIDGDTFDIDCHDGDKTRTRVRLLGVDTPAINFKNGDPVAGEPYGLQAGQYTNRMTYGKKVKLLLVEGKTRGHYDRILAYVELKNGKLLNRELIRNGYGFADSRSDHPLADEFDTIMQEAIIEKTGLWKIPAERPWYITNQLR